MLEKLLMNRRSTRKFQEKKVEAEKVEAIIRGALTAPTGRNAKPVDIVLVENKETLVKLANARGNPSKFIKEAPLAFVILGDTEKSDTWLADTAITATIIQLLAEEEGLKSCWAHMEKRIADDGSDAEENVRNILNIPAHHTPHCIIAVGYPGEEKRPYEEKDLDFTKIHREKF